MSQDDFIRIASKYFGFCDASTDWLSLLDRHVDIEYFLNEANKLNESNITEDELADFQYLYNEFPLSKLYEYFIEKREIILVNDKTEEIRQEQEVTSEIAALTNQLDEYKNEMSLTLKNGIDKCGSDIKFVQNQLLIALDDAKDALKESEEVKQIKVGIFKGNKEAIEGLQSAVAKLAKSGETQVTALTVQLIYMQRLAIISKKILKLGLMSTVATRTVISEIEQKLKDPDSKLNDIERQEFNKLLFQLKRNEDISSRLDKQKEGIVRHDKVLVKQGKQIDSILERVELLEKKLNPNGDDSLNDS